MISTSDFEKIKLILLDVDGTLTDGRYSYGSDGEVIKFFHIQDHHWIKLALRAGLKVGLLSGRADRANIRFAEELKISFAIFDAKDKLSAFQQLLSEYDLTPEMVLYVGDDVVDLPVLKRAGIAAVPADAVPELDEAAQWRTIRKGGEGAVCEIISKVLKEKGLSDKIMEFYRR